MNYRISVCAWTNPLCQRKTLSRNIIKYYSLKILYLSYKTSDYFYTQMTFQLLLLITYIYCSF